jgi:hypothetical protein
MMRRFLFLVCLFVAATASAARATTCEEDIVAAAKSPDIEYVQLSKILSFEGSASCMVKLLLLSEQLRGKVLVQSYLEQIKNSLQQNGSSVGTGGTTNLVSKGLTSSILSVAAEYGALTESTSNQTVTAQGSLGGIPLALIKAKLFSECESRLVAAGPCVNFKWITFLNRLSYGISFDTSQNSQTLSGTSNGQAQSGSTAQPVTFAANAHQISQVTGKFVIWPGAPATTSAFVQAVTTALDKQTSPTGDAGKKLEDIGDKLKTLQRNNSAAFGIWQTNALADLEQKSINSGNIYAEWEKLGCSLVKLLGESPKGEIPPTCKILDETPAGPEPDPILLDDALAYAYAWSNYFVASQQFTESLRQKPILTFEYDENRPASQPSNSTFRGIYSQNIKKWTLNGNAAISIYDSSPLNISGASRLRDVQAAFEADRALGSLSIIGSATMSFAYYFQHQNSPAILNVTPSAPLPGITFTGLPTTATQVFAQKGNISILQAKLALGSSQSTLHFPIAVSWSNRTELITKPVWRAQIGISYDLDSLFSGK